MENVIELLTGFAVLFVDYWISQNLQSNKVRAFQKGLGYNYRTSAFQLSIMLAGIRKFLLNPV